MNLISDLPAWLEPFRPDDERYADAYEGTPPERRALLKTAIAFCFHRWGQIDGEGRRDVLSARAGFSRTERSCPAAWVLAVTGEGFASPARFLAALVPAVLAGTGRVAVISAAPFAPAVATALELAGLEDSFVLDGQHAADLYEELHAASPDGRLILFPGGSGDLSTTQTDLLHRAAAHGVPVYRDRPAPALLSLYDGGTPGLPSPEEIRARLLWLHPDAVLLSPSAPRADAVFLPGHAELSCRAPLMAGPGMEACWPGPSPEFFRTRTLSAFLVQENQS